MSSNTVLLFSFKEQFSLNELFVKQYSSNPFFFYFSGTLMVMMWQKYLVQSLLTSLQSGSKSKEGKPWIWAVKN